MTTRLVACVAIPHLLAYIAHQQESIALTQPLAVVTGTTDRATIIDVCPRAAACGVQVGMSVFAARQQCHALSMTIVDPEVAEYAAESIEQILTHYTDVVTRRALGCWLLALVALGRQFVQADAVACQIQQAITRSTGWPCAIGLGPQRIVAYVAAQLAGERDPAGRIIVLPGAEVFFFEPLPVHLLPGVGAQTKAVLAQLGITTIGQLAELPQAILAQLVGPRGWLLHRHARGMDAEEDRTASLTLTSVWRWGHVPCADERQILARVYRLTERVGRRLRAQSLAAGQMTIRLRWVDGRQRQATHRCPARWDLDCELIQASYTALKRVLRERRLAVTEVGVSLGDLGPRQATLLGVDERAYHRQQALDQIKQRHGTSAILQAWLLAP